jgi:hypothetical protein
MFNCRNDQNREIDFDSSMLTNGKSSLAVVDYPNIAKK